MNIFIYLNAPSTLSHFLLQFFYPLRIGETMKHKLQSVARGVDVTYTAISTTAGSR